MTFSEARRRREWRIFACGAPAISVLMRLAQAFAQPAGEEKPASDPASAAPSATPSAVPSAVPSAAPTESAPAADDEAAKIAKGAAKEHLKAAKKHLDAKKYGPALAEYQAAYRISPSWGSRTAAGVCLVKLQRYDEAQETFEAAVRDFGDVMPKKAKDQALEQIGIMRTVTGAVNVTDAEVGALVVIDGRVRGEHPAPSPLSVLVGPHLVRVYKQGFGLYEANVSVEKGQVQTLAAKLTALVESKTGFLRVGEAGGKKMEVVVDGVPVGMTPWEGPVSAGEHSVVLRLPPPPPPKLGCGEPVITEDPRAAEAEQPLASAPMSVTVKPRETTPLQLKAQVMGAVVRIAPNPATATLFVDGIQVSRGGFHGRLSPGEHVIKSTAEGYFEETQKLSVPESGETMVEVALRKDLNASIWAEPSRLLFEIGGNAPIAPSLGGDIAETCGDGCTYSPGVGGRVTIRGGYELSNRLSFGLSAGYLHMRQSTTNRGGQLSINNTSSRDGVANDEITMDNALVGAYAAYRVGSSFPLRVSLGAGVAVGSIADMRTGIFQYTDAENNQRVAAVGPLTQSGLFTWAFIEPELRAGLRLSESWGIGLSVSGLVLLSPTVPQWKADMKINARENNFGQFGAETVTGGAFFAITQGLYISYER